MNFRRCVKCGAVISVTCACAIATVHHQNLCGQFDQGGVYCPKAVVESPHGPHHDLPISGAPTWIGTAASTGSSTVVFGGGTIPDHPSMTWSVKKGG
jgi:hypothetical protein